MSVLPGNLNTPTISRKSSLQARDHDSIQPLARCLLLSVHVAIPLTAGSLIYFMFRSESILAFRAIEWLSLEESLRVARFFMSRFSPHPFLLFSLPDGLWAYAFTSWISIVWDRKPPVLWHFLGVTLGVGSELGQINGIIPGTFQFEDVFFYIFGFATSWLVLRRWT
jgi:hypothetical protein